MGIRFTCPNGHRLHVKAFLAGRRGICPECGARFDIPHEDVAEVADASSASTTAATLPSVGQPGSGASDATRPTGEVTSVGLVAGSWFVCTASGDQFGPAASGVLRAWLDEGRIGRETLLWKEGWPSWERAVDVFPDHNFGASSAWRETTTGGHASSRTDRRRQRMLRTTAGLLALLLLLMGVLIWVVLKR